MYTNAFEDNQKAKQLQSSDWSQGKMMAVETAALWGYPADRTYSHKFLTIPNKVPLIGIAN